MAKAERAELEEGTGGVSEDGRLDERRVEEDIYFGKSKQRHQIDTVLFMPFAPSARVLVAAVYEYGEVTFSDLVNRFNMSKDEAGEAFGGAYRACHVESYKKHWPKLRGMRVDNNPKSGQRRAYLVQQEEMLGDG